MDWDVQIVHSVEEIGQEAWDRLGKERPFASYRWYRFGEASLSDDKPIYAILSRRGEMVARSTFWLTRREPLPTSSRVVRCAGQVLMRRRPLLICRSPLSSVSGLILPEPPLRDAAIQIIAQAAQEQGRQHSASFVIFDYLSEQETQWPGWPNTFAATTVPDPGTYLTTAWPDFESYLGQLSKSARKDYRRHRNRAADLHVETRCQPLVTALDATTLDQAMVLIRNVENHHDSPHNPWARSMLEHACMVDTFWLTAKVQDRLVGCGLLLRDGNTQEMRLLGLDYEVQYIYFQLVYAAIRHAIEEQVQVLQGGSGSYDMKHRLGFQLENNNHVVFVGRGGLLGKLGRRWTSTQ
jgi:predicted N-acyltransferase